MRSLVPALLMICALLAQGQPPKPADGCAPPPGSTAPLLPARLMEGQGTINFPITTTSAEDYPPGINVTSALVGQVVRVSFEVVLSTVHWLGGDGNWNDPTKWEGGAVPTALQNAVIAADGTYTVTLTGVVTVNSLEVIATPDASPTLRLIVAELTTAVFLFNSSIVEVLGLVVVHGDIRNQFGGLIRVSGGALGGSAALVFDGTFSNSGNIELGSTESEIAQLWVRAGGKLLNHPGAQIHVKHGAGGARGNRAAGVD